MVISPSVLGTKSDSTGEGQQQFNSQPTTIVNIIKFYIFMSNLHINILKQRIR
jgi:hypothetical protein